MKLLTPEGFLPGELRHLTYWVRERELLRLRKEEQGLPPPWSPDPLLSKFRWCNVIRMDDRVSRWLAKWHYGRHVSAKKTLFACAVGRLFNWPDTLAALPYPDQFDPDEYFRLLSKRALKGEKIFTGAYIINGAYGGPKYQQIVERVLTPMWEDPPQPDLSSMENTWKSLRGRPGMGSFMAGQVVADFRHVYPGEWRDALTWAPLGPGSARGLARLRGSFRQTRVTHAEALPMMRGALAHIQHELSDELPLLVRRLELMDVQNCLCEYDKYRRLTLDQGKVRSIYRSHEQPRLA